MSAKLQDNEPVFYVGYIYNPSDAYAIKGITLKYFATYKEANSNTNYPLVEQNLWGLETVKYEQGFVPVHCIVDFLKDYVESVKDSTLVLPTQNERSSLKKFENLIFTGGEVDHESEIRKPRRRTQKTRGGKKFRRTVYRK